MDASGRCLLRARRTALAVAVGCLWQSTTPAVAQVPSVNFRRPFAPMHPEGTFAAEPAAGLPAWRPHLGLWLSYADDVVEIRTLDDELVGTPVTAQWVAEAFVNWGIGSWLTVGALLPAAIYQTGDPVPVAGVPEVPTQALGDLSLRAKVSISNPSLEGTRVDGFGLAWMSSVSLPTAQRTSYLGDGQVSVESHANGEYNLGPATLRAVAGGYWRPTTRVYVGEEFGSALTWGGSAALRAYEPDSRNQAVTASVDFRGEVGLVEPFASTAASPALAGATGRYRTGSWSLLGGAEIPLNTAVGCPRVRLVVGAEWAPHDPDRDGDGITDAHDKCPVDAGVVEGDGCPDLDLDDDGVPDDGDQCLPGKAGKDVARALEDRDGFEDSDGCADPDNDADGVNDADDVCPDQVGERDSSRLGCPNLDADTDGVEDANDDCPLVPEDADKYADEDGCPDPDNDADGVDDAEDACPSVSGKVAYPPEERGCPWSDADRDTFPADVDRCPDQPEDFNGREDDDGCADALPGEGEGQRLVRVGARAGVSTIVFRTPPVVMMGEDGKAYLSQESLPSLRAVVRLLLLDKELEAAVQVRVGAQLGDAKDLEQALSKAERVVSRLNELAHEQQAAVVGDPVGFEQGAQAKPASVVVTLRRRNAPSE